MINILADRYLYNIRSYLPENINLTLFDPANGLPGRIRAAHGLLVRTVIPINKQTLPDIPEQLSFVGTGSAGTDHVDIDYLQQHGIAFADAAGCNARSVAEYVAAALMIWTDQKNKKVQDFSVGVIGVGHVGTQVVRLLNRMGVNTMAYDPPRENRETAFVSASADDLAECDILSFHTPLTTEGEHATRHWLDGQKLSGRKYQLVINTARGGVIDEQAVRQAMDRGDINDIIIDVWENEPSFDLRTAGRAFIKTPHIAGYSVQAKANASLFVADALLRHFDLPAPPEKSSDGPRIVKRDISTFDSLTELLTDLHPLKEYEKKLDKIIESNPGERGRRFNLLRAQFPLRREFSHIHLPAPYFERFPVLAKMGFEVL